MNPAGNHDRFPTLPDGSRDILHGHSHVDTWKSMEKLLATGKAKAIGVSNVSLPPTLSPSLLSPRPVSTAASLLPTQRH